MWTTTIYDVLLEGITNWAYHVLAAEAETVMAETVAWLVLIWQK